MVKAFLSSNGRMSAWVRTPLLVVIFYPLYPDQVLSVWRDIYVFVLGPYALVVLPVGRWHLRCVSGLTGYHALVC